MVCMNPAHLHLLVNHFPIIGTYLALPLLVLALVRRADRGALYALVLVLVISGAGAVAANLSGDPAEARVEDLPSVSKHWIDVHSDRADDATIIAVVTAVGALGLLGWTIRRGSTPIVGLGVLGFLTTLSAGAMAWTGVAGGQIHHGELREAGDNTSNASEHGGKGRRGPHAGAGERGGAGEAGEGGEGRGRPGGRRPRGPRPGAGADGADGTEATPGEAPADPAAAGQ